jgi:hypothetical protein
MNTLESARSIRAMTAQELTVDRDVFLNNSFVAREEVTLVGATIGGFLDCRSGHFRSVLEDKTSVGCG